MSKKYCIVCFVDDVIESKRSVDIVPTKWLHSGDKEGSFLCPFPTNFTEFNIFKLHKLVKELKPPRDCWKSYRVEIKGYSGKF